MKLGDTMKRLIIGAALAAIFSVPAVAQVSVLAGAGYTNASGNSGFGGGGSADITWGRSGFNTQVDALYESTAVGIAGADLQNWKFAGDLFWRGAFGSVGATVQHNDPKASVSAGGFSASQSVGITSYGGFGEWYAGPHFTLQAKAGGFSGDYSISGKYAGLGARTYLFRNMAVQIGYDYLDGGATIGHENIVGGSLELMASPRLPGAFSIGYSRVLDNGGSDAVMGRITFRFGSGQARDLQSWDRTGPSIVNGGLPL